MIVSRIGALFFNSAHLTTKCCVLVHSISDVTQAQLRSTRIRTGTGYSNILFGYSFRSPSQHLRSKLQMISRPVSRLAPMPRTELLDAIIVGLPSGRCTRLCVKTILCGAGGGRHVGVLGALNLIHEAHMKRILYSLQD